MAVFVTAVQKHKVPSGVGAPAICRLVGAISAPLLAPEAVPRADGEGEEGGSQFLSHLSAGLPFLGALAVQHAPSSRTNWRPDGREAKVRQRR